MNEIVIKGGSHDAGSNAALRVKELLLSARFKVFTADHHLHFSICGLPFFISDECRAVGAI